MPGEEEDEAPDDLLLLLLDSAPTAKTLSARAVFGEPHCGHLIFRSASLIARRCSNFTSQDLQTYS
jgi:hypothetical protein